MKEPSDFEDRRQDELPPWSSPASASRTSPLPCPDCPGVSAPRCAPAGAARRPDASLLALLPGLLGGCAFHTCSLSAREPVPPGLLEGSALTLVRRGIVVKERVDSAGRSTIIDVVGPGSVLAFSHRPGVTAFAAGPVMLCACPTDRLEDALAGPHGSALAREFLSLQQLALERLERLADARNRATVGARIAALLCALADGLSAPRRLAHLPSELRQRDFGALLAIRHESVCRELRRLERAGVVRRVPEGLQLVDRAALEEAGGRGGDDERTSQARQV